jgi:hypothetical protein
MKYTPALASKAREILTRLMVHVHPRKEYDELVAILDDPSRWKEAHAQFSRIRTRITLPAEDEKREDLDAYFAFVAEGAAKTAYNCSGEPAPFDDDSFQWLLRSESEFLAQREKGLTRR